MRKALTIFLLLWGSMSVFAQTKDFQYYKSLGTVQYYERNFLEAVFNLQQASSLKPTDKEVGNFLKMSYDSLGSKDLSGKTRMKIEKFGDAASQRRPTVQPPTIEDNTSPGKRKKDKYVERHKYRLQADLTNYIRQLGDYFMDRESYDSAVVCYKQYLGVRPWDSSVQYYMGTSLYYLKRYDEAIEAYEAVLNKEPRRADIYNWIGVCEFLSGNYLAARDNFKQCIKYDKDYTLAYFNLGKTQYELEDYSSAAKNLEHALELMPKDKDIIRMLADIYYMSSDWDRAKKMYEQMYPDNKRNERVNYRLGDICLRQGQWNNAITYLDQFLDLAPNNADGMRKIGIAYYNTEKYTFAIEYFEKASKTLWDDKELMLYCTIAANKLGNYQRAVEFGNRAISLDNRFGRAYYQLGLAYKGLGQRKLAKENMAKAKDLDANNITLIPGE
jgi:tetratricopeptide (TPR) repeat protein